MRILHLLQSDRISGAENVVADICMMFNNEIEMIYCSPDGPIREALLDREVSFFPLNKLSASEVKRAVTEYKPDIIHAHDVRATLLASLVSGKIPLISHLHGNDLNMRRLHLKSLLYLLATKKARKIVAVSESCLNDYIFGKQVKKKAICLRNVVYPPRIEKLMIKDTKEYYFDFVFFGRISYPKDPKRVAQVASIVLKQCPTATFGVIGEGDLKSEMDEVFQIEGLSNRVIFTGRLAYPYKALRQAKCMLMCSIYEGTPIAVLEAMALGVPIVSTPVDGIIDVVNNGKTGYLLAENSELAKGIQDIITDTNKHTELSFNSRNHFSHLNKTLEYKDELYRIYNNVVQRLKKRYTIGAK